MATQSDTPSAPQAQTVEQPTPPPLLEELVAKAVADGLKKSEAPSVLMTDQGLRAQTMRGLHELAGIIVRSGWAPKGMNAEACFTAMAKGAEVGLSHLEALYSIAVINGRPAIWGDAMLALVMASGKLEDKAETFEGEGDQLKAVCLAKRRGMATPVRWEFSVADAKQAGLWGNSGTWKQYSRRMLQMRARAFALRDAFPDVLRGLVSAEEARDIPPEAEDGPLPAVDPKGTEQEQMLQMFGGDNAANGTEQTEPDVTLGSFAEPADPEPREDGPGTEPQQERHCSKEQATKLTKLAVKTLKCSVKTAPEVLANQAWEWNEGKPIGRQLKRFSDLSEAEAVRMIGELEGLQAEMAASEGGA